MYDDKTTTIEELKSYVKNFREERDWDKFHNVKNLAVSVAVESSELLRNFEWSFDGDNLKILEDPLKMERISRELPDVLSKVLEFSEKYGVPIESALYPNYNEQTTVDELKNGSIRCKKQEHEVHYRPRSLAMEIYVAAGKVMEYFTSVPDEECEQLLKSPGKSSEILCGLSDVLYFILEFSKECNIDIATAFYKKMKENERNYYPEKAKGKNLKYKELRNPATGMILDDKPFGMINAGKKSIEIRLYDESNREIKLGDKIVFYRRPALNQRIEAEVVGLLHYKIFEELVNDFPTARFGCSDENKGALIDYLNKTYPAEWIQRSGVIGIEIRKSSSVHYKDIGQD